MPPGWRQSRAPPWCRRPAAVAVASGRLWQGVRGRRRLRPRVDARGLASALRPSPGAVLPL
eukprot:14858291-Heterocapsa_arctica.AAC.1